MKIGIDARFYGPRVGGGGIGRYISELIQHLQKIDTVNEYVIFLKKENFHECVITNPNFYKKLVDVHWYGLKEQRIMPKEIRLSGIDFMHYPHWNIPIFSRIPFIVTVHDLILLEDRFSARSTTRNPFLYGFKFAAFRFILENAIHRSRHIITVSDYSKKSILGHFGITPKKVSVIRNGLSSHPKGNAVSLTRLGVYEPYFLYVGNSYPHKNLGVLIGAFAKIMRDFPHTQLVLAGKRDTFSRMLETYATSLGVTGEKIRFIDTPEDNLLHALYEHALAFIYPSRIEGFGIPPLEALAHGKPVFSSFTTSMPEILGEAVTYFDPEQPKALAKLMKQILTNPTAFDHLATIGKAQAAKYTWQKAAEETLYVYQHYGKKRP